MRRHNKFIIDGNPVDHKGDVHDFTTRINQNKSQAPQRHLTGFSGYASVVAEGKTSSPIGYCELMGHRKEQQDAIAMGFLTDFPEVKSDEKPVRAYFEKQTAATVDHLNSELGEAALQYAGSTRTSAVVDTRTKTVWSNNIGDGVIFLMTKQANGSYIARQLNRLDNPQDSEEKARLLQLGVRLTYDDEDDQRINQLLAWVQDYSDSQEDENNYEWLCHYDFFTTEEIAQHEESIPILYSEIFHYHRNSLVQRMAAYLKHIPQRLDGRLAVSASFGDTACPGVRRTPKVTAHRYPPGSFLFVACDGVELKETAIAQIFNTHKHKTPEEIAIALGNKSLPSRDNISGIVVDLDGLPAGSISEFGVMDGHGPWAENISNAIAKHREKAFTKPAPPSTPQPEWKKDLISKLVQNKQSILQERHAITMLAYGKLLGLLVDKLEESYKTPMTAAEAKAVFTGKIGELVKPYETQLQVLIDKSQPQKAAKNNWKETLSATLLEYLHDREDKSKYLKGIGLFSKTTKTTAVKKLLAHLGISVHRGVAYKAEALSWWEKQALFNGTLNDRTQPYKEKIEQLLAAPKPSPAAVARHS